MAIGIALGVASVVSSVAGGISSRNSAKKNARAKKEQLRLNYNFDMNDSEREMLLRQEEMLFEQRNQELEKNSVLADLSYGAVSAGVESESLDHLKRIVNTQSVMNQMRADKQYNTSLDEYRRYKENKRFLMERGVQSASNSVPSFFETAVSSGIQGATSAAPLFMGGGD